MTIIINEGAPLSVKEKLLEWQRQGWVIIEQSSDADTETSFNDHKPGKYINADEGTSNDESVSIEQEWVNQLKAIGKEIAKQLNQLEIQTRARGLPRSYIFVFNAEGFCKMLDKLLEYHKNYIADYLHHTRKPKGVTLICPFLGEIINAHLFNTQDIQKTDLKEVLAKFYNNTETAVKKLSIHSKLLKNQDAQLLVEVAKTIGKKYANS